MSTPTTQDRAESALSWHPAPEGSAAAVLRTRFNPPAEFAAGLSLYAILDWDDSLLRRSIAVHEAGHALLDFAFGIRVQEMRIDPGLGKDPDGPPTAYVKVDACDVPFLRFAAMCAAGERAQDRWMREQGLWTPARAWCVERTATDDRAQAAEALKPCGIPVRFADATGRGIHYQTIQDTADAALGHLWPRVLRLAEALDAAGHLTGEEAAHHAGMTHRMKEGATK